MQSQNLKVKIPQHKKNSFELKKEDSINNTQGFVKKNSNTSEDGDVIAESSEAVNKFPQIIDETVKDTRDFIKFLHELNKKDLSSQDKKRMENYLSKSISEAQKKISDDIQKMNK